MADICNLAEQLKKAGYKLTPTRRAVIDMLETETEHPSHQQILEEGW